MARKPDTDLEEPPSLRRLRLLVSVLMGVLILGFVAVSAMLVIRLGDLGGAERADTAVTPLVSAVSGAARIVAAGRESGQIVVVIEDPSGSRFVMGFDGESGLAVETGAVLAPGGEHPGSGGGNGAPQ